MRRCTARPGQVARMAGAARGLTEDPGGSYWAGWGGRRLGRSGRPPNGTGNPDRTDHLGPSSVFTSGSEEPHGRSALSVTPDACLGETQVFAYAGATAPPLWLRANTPLSAVRVART